MAHEGFDPFGERPVSPRRGVGRWLKGASVGAVIAVLAVLYLATGVYTVAPDEQGVVLRFGRVHRVTPPGLGYRLPYPVETVLTPKVTEVKRVEIGFRTIRATPPAQYRAVPEESLMLTGDENLLIVEMIAQYRIRDAGKYLFRLKDPDLTVHKAAQAALRQVVGSRMIDDVLTEEKFAIQEETKGLLQAMLDRYESGLVVLAVQLQDVKPPEPVMAAFRDVASAREDSVRFVNEAESYRNQVIPQARGEAAKLIEEAQAYREARIARAQGDVERFVQLLGEYQGGREVTRTRLHLETLEKILPGIEKVIVEDNQGVLKLLNLDTGEGVRR